MEVKNKYGKSQVVVLNVGQDDLDGMLINWDLTDNGRYDYMEKEFVDSVMGYLPEYAMGYDAGNISITNMVEQVRETAKSVIQIKRINEIKQYLEKDREIESMRSKQNAEYSFLHVVFPSCSCGSGLPVPPFFRLSLILNRMHSAVIAAAAAKDTTATST